MSIAFATGALRNAALVSVLALLAIGLAWGLTTPLAKIAVSTGHGPFGLLLWVAAIDTFLLWAFCAATGRRPGYSGAHLRLYAVVGLCGMVMPQVATYVAAPHLPGGVLALVVSMVPMLALPMALLLGLERLRARRALGVLLGAGAVAVILGPDTSLPDRAAALFVLVAAMAPLCYALEGLYVEGWGTRASDPVETLAGAAGVALIVALPLAYLSGQAISPLAPWGAPERAIVLSACLSVFAYTGYVWLLRRAGAVFAGQVAYIVTAGGVLWSMVLLGERFGPWFWAALAALLAGIFLVQPRSEAATPPGRARASAASGGGEGRAP
ncbi:MAG: DMT family transporter [Rhodobacteraceae bacterium]|nr:DMT family transporter [Paracoccaceae bacterium]